MKIRLEVIADLLTILLISIVLTALLNLGALTLLYAIAAVGVILLTRNEFNRIVSHAYLLFILLSCLFAKLYIDMWFYFGPALLSIAFLVMLYFINKHINLELKKFNNCSSQIYMLLTFDIIINILAFFEFGTDGNLIYTIYPIATHFVNLAILTEILKGNHLYDSKRSGYDLPIDCSNSINKNDHKDRKMAGSKC